MAEKWRWIGVNHGDPDDNRHRLVIDDGSPFGGTTILECGNLDSAYQDRIGRLPEIETACKALVSWSYPLSDYPPGDAFEALQACIVLAKAALAKGDKPDV